MNDTVASENLDPRVRDDQELLDLYTGAPIGSAQRPSDCNQSSFGQEMSIDGFEENKNTYNSCSDVFNTGAELHSHQSLSECKQRSLTKTNFFCPCCKRSFGHGGALKNHTKYCFKTQNPQRCVKIAPRQAQLVNSQVNRFKVESYQGDLENSTECTTNKMVDEFSLAKVSDETGDKTYFKGTNISRVCDGCDLIFKSPTHVRAHLQKKKLYCRRPPFLCGKCGKICKNVHALVDHERSRVACRKWLILNHGSDVQLTFQDQNFKYSGSLEFQEIPVGGKNSSSDSLNNSITFSDVLDASFIKPEMDSQVLIKQEIDQGFETISSSPQLSEPLVLEGTSKVNCVEEDQSFSCRECQLQFVNSYRLRKHIFTMHRKFNPQSSRSKYTPSPSQSSPRKNHSDMNAFKCEGGYRCPTCLLVFNYPSKISTHLFRKGKCYPPNFEESKDSSIGIDRINLKRKLEKDHDLSLNEAKIPSLNENGKPEIKINTNFKYPGTSLDGIPTDNTLYSINPKQRKLNTPLKGKINLDSKPNRYEIPKRKILKNIVKKYRKFTGHNNGVVPFCEFCQLSFCNNSGLTKHYEKYHSGESPPTIPKSNIKRNPYGCPFCDRNFLSLKARNSHIRYGHKDIPEEKVSTFLSDTLCEVCGKAFEMVANLQEHFSRFHSQQFTDLSLSNFSPAIPALKCTHCCIQFSTKHHYSAHVNRYCPSLKERLKSGPVMSRHAVRRKSVVLAKTLKKRPKGGFMCTHCQTKFSYRTLYKAHINRYCPMKPSSLPETKINSVSNGSKMVCPFCQQIFVRKHLYDTHVRSVCSKRPTASITKSTPKGLPVGRWYGKQYSCGGCRKVFADRKILNVHQKMGCSGIAFGPCFQAASTDDKSKTRSKDWLGIGFSYVCQNCNNRFNSKKTLVYHKKIFCIGKVSSPNVSYERPSAPLRSENLPNESALSGISYVCRACQNTFISRKTLYNHQKLVCKGFKQTSESPKLPSSPNSSNNTPQLLEKASKVSGMTYTCRGCLSRFETRRDLYSHKISNCRSSESKDGLTPFNCHKNTGFACKLCSKQCISRKVLFVHQKFHCKFSKFKSPNFLTKLPVNLPKFDGFSDQRFYQCKSCPEKLSSRKDLFVHHKYHCVGRIPHLKKEVKSQLHLGQHQIESISSPSQDEVSKAKSQPLKYSCSQCKKGFQNRKVLHLHKKYNCLGGKNILESAMETAEQNENVSGVKGYVCKRCRQTYANRKLLYIHKKCNCPGKVIRKPKIQEELSNEDFTLTPKDGVMTTEIAEKLLLFPNQCPFCKRQYCNPFVRDRHIKLHTMVKSFRCSFCPQTFSRSEYLTRHMQNEHTEQLRYQCGKCGLKYARRINCIQHLNKLHKVVNKIDLLIDLQESSSQGDKLEVKTQEVVSSKQKPAIPKLTLKRTSHVTRFKNRRAVWKPSMAPNFFRVVDDTPGRGIYSCDLCQMAKFSKMATLHRHWRSRLHKENVARQRIGLIPLSSRVKIHIETLICSVCCQSFPTVQAFVPHRLSHLNDPYEINDLQPYSCEICSSIFTHHQRVQGHLMWHLRVNKNRAKESGLQPIQPVVTNRFKVVAKKSTSPFKEIKPLKNLQELSSSSAEFLSPAISILPQEPFECNMCSAQYASKSGVNTHMHRFCPKRFSCDKCSQCFSNSRALAYHKGKDKCTIGKKDTILKCRHCSLELETAEDLGWHEKSCRKVHEAEKAGAFEGNELSSLEEDRYQCSSCKQSFSSITAACKHEEICLSTRSLGSSLSYHCLQCMVCNENFYSVRILEKHANVLCMERFYVRCLPCQKLFHNLKDLSEHILKLSSSMSAVEEDKASEVASSQSDSSILPSNLQSPGNNLQFNKPLFPCQQCHRVFHDRHNMKVHTVIHTPFHCQVCNNVETTKQGFRLHKCLLPDGSFATGLWHRKLGLRNSPTSSERVNFSESAVDCQETKLPGCSLTQCKSDSQLLKTPNAFANLNKLRGDFSQLMFFLVADPELMTQLGWGQKPIDSVLQDVLLHLGEKPASEGDTSVGNERVLELLKENVRRFLKLSIKEDVLDTLQGIDHSSIDVVVSKMLGMCTDNGDREEETSLI